MKYDVYRSSPYEFDSTGQGVVTPKRGRVNLDVLIGKTEAEATDMVREYGATIRVVERDGKFSIVTRDYRNDRVNLHLSSGLVNRATIG